MRQTPNSELDPGPVVSTDERLDPPPSILEAHELGNNIP